MTRIPLCLLVAILLLPACGRAGGDLGERIAGAWLGSCEFGERSTTEAAFITTYYADGTGMTTSAMALGGGDPELNGLSTTQHIIWEEAGGRSIRWRILHFGHYLDGSLKYVSRTHGVMEFDEEFESCSGSFTVEVFEPEDLLEPLAPNAPQAEPLATPEGACRARRLHIEIP